MRAIRGLPFLQSLLTNMPYCYYGMEHGAWAWHGMAWAKEDVGWAGLAWGR